jgi:hypothetical protein
VPAIGGTVSGGEKWGTDREGCGRSTQRRKRSVFYNALGYAVEHGHLAANRIDRIGDRGAHLEVF